MVAYLTDALIELGHDVTLFASGDSLTKAKLVPVWPRALRLDPNIKDFFAPVFMELETVARRAPEFDVIHAHLDYFGYPLLRRLGVPAVTTLHGRLDLPQLPPLYDLYGDIPVVSISNAQRAPLPQANYMATILHGLPQDLLAKGSGSGGLPGVSRPHLSRKSARCRDSNCRASGTAAQDRRQGGSRR